MKKFGEKTCPEPRRRIGLLGLSADPPHLAHLAMAKLLLKKRLADEIWLIPCRKHSFGKLMAPLEHRWQMAKLLEEPGIKTSDAEIKRQGISYTIDTVRTLREQYPDCQFFWILGSDIVKLGSYKKWKNWQELFSSVKFLVVLRPGFKVGKLPEGFILVKGRINNISSTEIRERIGRGLPIDNLVPPKIKEYIEKYGLYKN